jgi:hypothetical protein
VKHDAATGLFAAELTDLELFEVVGRVARAVNPAAPDALSQPQFDRHVDEHREEHPGVPTARAIYMRLNSGSAGRVTWKSIVRAACDSGASARQTLVAATRSAPDVPVTDRVVFFALTLVAKNLNTRTVSRGEYDEERARLRMLDRRRGGLLATLLPTNAQLAQHAGGWDEALLIAGLEPRPKTIRRPAAAESVSVVHALGLYLEHHGALASRLELRRFATDANFALADENELPWDEYICSFRQECERLGRWCPPGYPPHKQRIRYRVTPDAFDGLPRRHGRSWDELDACAEAVMAYWATLPGREEPTQKRYGRWAVGKPHPAPSAFAQHGGFIAVKDRARELRRQRAAG